MGFSSTTSCFGAVSVTGSVFCGVVAISISLAWMIVAPSLSATWVRNGKIRLKSVSSMSLRGFLSLMDSPNLRMMFRVQLGHSSASQVDLISQALFSLERGFRAILFPMKSAICVRGVKMRLNFFELRASSSLRVALAKMALPNSKLLSDVHSGNCSASHTILMREARSSLVGTVDIVVPYILMLCRCRTSSQRRRISLR